jgi:hypothetical protein
MLQLSSCGVGLLKLTHVGLMMLTQQVNAVWRVHRTNVAAQQLSSSQCHV